MQEKYRKLEQLNDCLLFLSSHTSFDYMIYTLYDNEELTYEIRGLTFDKDEFVIYKDGENVFRAVYSMDRDAGLRANRINRAINLGARVSIERDNLRDEAFCFVTDPNNYRGDLTFSCPFAGLRCEGTQILPVYGLSLEDIERMANGMFNYGYGTGGTTGYTYTYNTPRVRITNNINNEYVEVAGDAQIVVDPSGVSLRNGSGMHTIIHSGALMSMYGNQFATALLDYANRPTDDPIERMIRDRIKEIFNNSMGGGR